MPWKLATPAPTWCSSESPELRLPTLIPNYLTPACRSLHGPWASVVAIMMIIDTAAIVGIIVVRIVVRTVATCTAGTARQQYARKQTQHQLSANFIDNVHRYFPESRHTLYSLMGVIDFIMPRNSSRCAFVVSGRPMYIATPIFSLESSKSITK